MILDADVALAQENKRFSFQHGHRWDIYSILEGYTDTVMPTKLSVNSKITELRQFDCLGC